MTIAITIGAVVKKTLELLAVNDSGRKFLGYVLCIAVFLLLLPVIVVCGLFGWMANDGSTLLLREELLNNLPEENAAVIEQMNTVCDTIQNVFEIKGLSVTDERKAEAIYLTCLHSVFSKGTIEFRLFNSTLHAGEVKSYIQLCLAISHQALIQKSASHTRTQSSKEKYTFRTWLLRLGLIGDEFKTARTHLLKNLDGNIAWKDPAQAEAQKYEIYCGKKLNRGNVYRVLKNSGLKEMFIVRYADDFRIFCRRKSDAEKVFHAVKQWLKGNRMVAYARKEDLQNRMDEIYPSQKTEEDTPAVKPHRNEKVQRFQKPHQNGRTKDDDTSGGVLMSEVNISSEEGAICDEGGRDDIPG